MNNKVVLNFGNIVHELEDKNLKLCFIKDRSIFVTDAKGNMYQIESYWYGSYLDKLIKNGSVVEFNIVSVDMKYWQIEIWGADDVNAFIERQSLKCA